MNIHLGCLVHEEKETSGKLVRDDTKKGRKGGAQRHKNRWEGCRRAARKKQIAMMMGGLRKFLRGYGG
jgi:hypothetical protein